MVGVIVVVTIFFFLSLMGAAYCRKKRKEEKKKYLVFRQEKEARDEKRTKYSALAKNEYLSKLLFVDVLLLLLFSLRTVHYNFFFLILFSI